jgi:hypothetical protein
MSRESARRRRARARRAHRVRPPRGARARARPPPRRHSRASSPAAQTRCSSLPNSRSLRALRGPREYRPACAASGAPEARERERSRRRRERAARRARASTRLHARRVLPKLLLRPLSQRAHPAARLARRAAGGCRRQRRAANLQSPRARARGHPSRRFLQSHPRAAAAEYHHLYPLCRRGRHAIAARSARRRRAPRRPRASRLPRSCAAPRFPPRAQPPALLAGGVDSHETVEFARGATARAPTTTCAPAMWIFQARKSPCSGMGLRSLPPGYLRERAPRRCDVNYSSMQKRETIARGAMF